MTTAVDLYVCPQHTRDGGYVPSGHCGGWPPGDPGNGKICTEAEKEQADCVRRLHNVGSDITAAKQYEMGLAAKRRGLIRELTVRFGWSQGQVAAELGVTSQRICKLLRTKKGDP